MFKKLQKPDDGFTIIEVLIVLAIAGLIMLVVFLAIPALQRNQRNNTRNAEGSRIGALVAECMSNRNGQITSCDTADEIGWRAADFQQLVGRGTPTAGPVLPGTGTVPGTVPTDAPANTFTWGFGRICEANGATATATGANARGGVVIYLLETTSGGVTSRCINV